MSIKRSQTVALLCVLLAGLTFSALVASSFFQQERRETLAGFNAEVDAIGSQFFQELTFKFESLYLLKALFDGSTAVSEEEFQRVANETLARHSDILALGWVPQIEQPESEPSYTLDYLAPGKRRSGLQDFNLAAVPAIRPALQAGLAQRTLQMVVQFPLFAQEPELRGVLALLPVVKTNASTDDKSSVSGFIVGFLHVEDLLSRLLKKHPAADLDLTLLDHSMDPEHRILYQHQSKVGVAVSTATYSAPLPAVAGHQLSLQARPTDNYLTRHSSQVPHLIMLSGFLFTFLVAAYLRATIVRSAEIEDLVKTRTRKLHETNDKLANLSMTDGLTNIANRRNFDSHLDVEWKRGIRERQPLTLMLIDIDCFKDYNDHYGHLQGDHCLRQVARVLHEQTSRPRDLVARYGGEEFALILPHTDSAAKSLGEQCRTAVEDLTLPHTASRISGNITISVGVASMVPQRGSQAIDLIALADQALYRAKKTGRNRVILAD
jgi:diguanylate cyclase (GGDEF)-like protein